MTDRPLDYAAPPPRRVRGWQFVFIAAVVALGVWIIGLITLAASRTVVPAPTSRPAYTGW